MYPRLVRAQARAQAQYRFSFALDMLMNALGTVLDLVSVLVLFRVAHTLGGFGVREAFFMASLAGAGFALGDLVVGNVDRLRLYVRTGTLDSLLVRPLRVLPQLIATDFGTRRIGRVVQGIVVLAVAAWYARVQWTPARIFMIVLAPLSGAVFFAGWFILGATVVFWWIESGEFLNSVTDGGRAFATYPIGVYSGLFRRVFAYGLGFAFVGYYPALALLGRPDPLGAPAFLDWCSPAVSALVAGIAALAWRTGIRHYRSTGS